MRKKMELEKVRKSRIGIFILLTFVALLLTACGSSVSSPASSEAPTNLSISANSDGSIVLEWDYSASDSITYVIARKAANSSWNESYTKVKTKTYTDQLSLTDSLVYSYKVLAINSSNESSAFSNVAVYFTPQTKPSDLSVIQSTQNKLIISWVNHCVGHTGYILEKKVNNGSWIAKYKTLGPLTTSVIDTTSNYTTVMYRVYAYNADKTSPATEISFTSSLAPPSNLTYQQISANIVRLYWTDNSDEESGYYVDKRIGEGNWDVSYATLPANSTTWSDNTNIPCGTVHYRVRSFKDASSSSSSNEIAFNVRLNLVGSFLTSPNATKISVSGWRAYVADYYEGLKIVNCSNPNNPQEISNSLELEDRTISLCNYQNMLFVTSQTGRDIRGKLSSINIDVPSNPTVIGQAYTTGVPYDVAIEGDYAYIADGENGLSIYYIPIATPVFLTNITCNSEAKKVAVDAKYVVTANGADGFTLFNVANPMKPIKLVTQDTPGYVSGVAIKGNYLYIADGDKGIAIYNVARKSDPVEVARVATNGFVSDLQIRDNTIFATDQERGLIAIDINIPTSAYIIGVYPMSTQPKTLALYSSYAFILDSQGIKIIQIKP